MNKHPLGVPYTTQQIERALKLVRNKMYELRLQRDRLKSMLKERKKELDEICYNGRLELEDAVASHILAGRNQRYVGKHLGLSADIIKRILLKWVYRKNKDLYGSWPDGKDFAHWIRENKDNL